MAKTTKTPAAAKKEDLERNHYPAIEKLFETGTLPGFLQKAEQTCRELDALIDSGNQRDAARAKAAMAGYGKTLELLQELRGMAEAQEETGE